MTTSTSHAQREGTALRISNHRSVVTRHSQGPSRLPLQDYLLLLLLRSQHSNDADKLYLSELSAQLRLSTREVSALASALQKKGFAQWLKDDKGTYLQFTLPGSQPNDDPAEALHSLYSKVISTYGEEKFHTLMTETAALRSILTSEMDKLSAQEK